MTGHKGRGAVMLMVMLAGCAGHQTRQGATSFYLDVSHPSPRSSYLRIGPGFAGAPLPQPGQIESAGFSRYLRRLTGCVVNPAYPVRTLGHAAAPAGYMVPVSCG